MNLLETNFFSRMFKERWEYLLTIFKVEIMLVVNQISDKSNSESELQMTKQQTRVHLPKVFDDFTVTLDLHLFAPS